MKTIKVFLASSNELIEERKELGFLFCHLNRIYRPRGIYLELVPWEYLDSSMCPSHKQQEYNKELDTCELCLVLFWTKFGDYTYEEFTHAYNRLKQGLYPRKLYVFFKEPGDISPDLQRFKDKFDKDYGHFYSKFENLGTLKFEFLVQLEAYQNTGLFKVEDSIVKFDDIEVTHTKNLPFISNDNQLNEVRSKSESIDEKIRLLTELYEVAPNEDRRSRLEEAKYEKQEILKTLAHHEQSMVNIALQVASTTSIRISQNTTDAILAFQNGDISKANSMLQHIESEVDMHIANYEYASSLLELETQNGITLIDSLLLKAVVLMSDLSISHDQRVNQALACYRKAINLTERYNLHTRKYPTLYKHTIFLIDNAFYEEALESCEDLEKLCPDDPSEKGKFYNLWGSVYDSLYKHEQALELYYKAYVILAGTDNIIEKYNTLINLGSVMYSLNKHAESLRCYAEALNAIKDNELICRALMAKCHTNIGVVYDSMGDYTASLEYHYHALKIYKELYSETNINIALCHNNIGTALLKTDSIKALQHFRQALELCIDIKGHYHPTTAVCNMNIGQWCESYGEYEEAVSYYTEALKIRKVIYGEKHEIVAKTLSDIGAIHYTLGKYDQALNIYREAADIYRIYGKENCVDKYISHIQRVSL